MVRIITLPIFAPVWQPGSRVNVSCFECSFQLIPTICAKYAIMDKYRSLTWDVQASKVKGTLLRTS